MSGNLDQLLQQHLCKKNILLHVCNQTLQVLRRNFDQLVTAHLLGKKVRKKKGSADADANLISMCVTAHHKDNRKDYLRAGAF